jgi:predicted RND superfamily exporter protein
MGLVVDSTVHLLHGKKEQERPEIIYFTTMIPIILSHILLFISFLLLSFEHFIPIRDFGFGLVILLAIGLLCDLWVLPMISQDKSTL